MSNARLRADRSSDSSARDADKRTRPQPGRPTTSPGPESLGNRHVLNGLRAGGDRPAKARQGAPLAYTRDGNTYLGGGVASHPKRPEILAHEAAHRRQFASKAPIGNREQLESDAGRGAQQMLDQQPYTPTYSAPAGMALGYGGAADWFPDLESRDAEERRSAERFGLTGTEPDVRQTLGINEDPSSGRARATYTSSVAASGDEGSILSDTMVSLDYHPDRRATVVGPAVININPEIGLGPTDDVPAYPYVLTYTRTISYVDAYGRTASVDVRGEVHLSEAAVDRHLMGTTPSFESLVSMLGETGGIDVTLEGDGPITGYFGRYFAAGNSLQVQANGAASMLGNRSGAFTSMSTTVPAWFVDPRMTAGAQYDSLRSFLVSADQNELMRRLSEPPAVEPSWLDSLTDAMASALGAVFGPIFEAMDAVSNAVSEFWNSLPPWARGIITAVAKFLGYLALMMAAAGLIVLAAKGAIAFGTAMLIVFAVALTVGYIMSYINRFMEVWNSEDAGILQWLAIPFVALLDVIGISHIIEGITDESILTGTPMNRSEEERWEAGTTGVLQLVGLLLMVRSMRAGGGGRLVAPEARGNLADFHALPAERLPRLPEGHFWQRTGGEWTIFRDPATPEVPIEISIFSDGQGRINYVVRSGDMVLQSDAMTRSPTYRGGENRLPPELRGTGEANPYLQEGTLVLREKGHLIDYADRLEGPGVRSSNADPANFVPQARFWNSFLRNHLVRAIRGRGGNYREMPIYDSVPPRTVDGTPIPREFIFVETTATGEPVAAWRIPNDPAITTRRMADLPDYSIPLSDVPSAVFGSGAGTGSPGGTFGPIILEGGEGGEGEGR